jgi:hypothetical protein
MKFSGLRAKPNDLGRLVASRQADDAVDRFLQRDPQSRVVTDP